MIPNESRREREPIRITMFGGLVGDAPAAISLYERALDSGAVSEEIHVQLMRCHALVGQRRAAAQVVDHCRSLLARRFRMTPSSATVLAFRSIVQS